MLDGIWETHEKAQRDVGVDDDEHVGDDEEANIRDIEKGEAPMPRGVDEFTAPHSVTDERQAPDHILAQLSGQRQHV